MHAGDDNLFVASGDDVLELTSDLGQPQRAAQAACRGDDAVAALLFTAGLHADRKSRAPGDAWFERATRSVAFSIAMCRRERSQAAQIDQREQVILERIVHDLSDVRLFAELLST